MKRGSEELPEAVRAGQPGRAIPSPFITRLVLSLAAGVFLAGCASTPARDLHERLRETQAGIQDGLADPGADPVRDGNAGLADYLRLAFARNPRLRAAFERWQAAMERIPQSRAWEDPTLTFEYFLEQMDTRYQASLTQMFPAFGVTGLRARQAGAEAEAAMHAFDAERFDLFEKVTRAVHEYRFLARATAVMEENVRLLADLEQATDSRYRSGAATFADLIKAQVEKARLADRLAGLVDERRVRSANLAAQLNLPADEPLPWPAAEESASAWIDEPALAELLADLNPELRQADAQLEAAAQGEALARREGWPRVMAGVGWMVMPGMEGRGDENDVGLMAGVTLPVWRGRYRAAQREAVALTRAAGRERDDLRNRLRAELAMAVFEFRDAERRIALYRDALIPRAEQALAVAKQEYAAGESSFAALIEAQRELLEFRLAADRAAADREIALGDIGCCVGAFDPGREERE